MSSLQYRATGQCLLRAFPNKPRSSVAVQYNNAYIFNELDKVNSLRNRIAHHEPICFRLHASEIDTSYIVNEYQKIQTLFSWMGIDSRSMLYDNDSHAFNLCAKTAEQMKAEYREVISLPRKGYSIRDVAKLCGKGVSTVQRVKQLLTVQSSQ